MTYRYQINTIVNHGIGEKLAAQTREAGARGGTILVGRGSAHQGLLRLLALSDVEKDILVTLVTAEEYESVWAALCTSQLFTKKNRGICYTIPLHGGSHMNERTTHELITIISNRGYADDIMDAARKAGARGGTIVHARGTGTTGDAKFFGVTIVPEKEEILILAETSTVPAIEQAIQSLPCLKEAGMGILFTTPVSRFSVLGG